MRFQINISFHELFNNNQILEKDNLCEVESHDKVVANAQLGKHVDVGHVNNPADANSYIGSNSQKLDEYTNLLLSISR